MHRGELGTKMRFCFFVPTLYPNFACKTFRKEGKKQSGFASVMLSLRAVQK